MKVYTPALDEYQQQVTPSGDWWYRATYLSIVILLPLMIAMIILILIICYDIQHDDDVDCWHGGCQAAWANWCHDDGANPIVLMTSSVNGDINTDTYHHLDAMKRRFFLSNVSLNGLPAWSNWWQLYHFEERILACKCSSQIDSLTLKATSLFGSELMWWHQGLIIWCWWWW